MAENMVQFGFMIPKDLRERARRIGKRLQASIAYLVCEGLRQKCDEIEAKWDAEEEGKEKAKEKMIERRTLGTLGQRSLAPAPLAPFREEVAEVTVDEETNDAINDIYEQQARKIFDVLDSDPNESRVRAREAVIIIKKFHPLTHPSDQEITKQLERIVIRMRSQNQVPQAPAPVEEDVLLSRVVDALTGRILNTANVKTRGEKIDDEE